MAKLLLCLMMVASFGAHVAQSYSITSGRLSVNVDPTTFKYAVVLDGTVWFDSSDPTTNGYSFSADGATYKLADKSLVAHAAPAIGNGTDGAGLFDSISIGWTRASKTTVEFITTFKAYHKRNAIVFQQQWPNALSQTKGSIFPSLSKVWEGKIGALEYTGSSCGFMVGSAGSFPGIRGGSSKGYIVLAPEDTTGEGVNATFAIGPVTEHFVNQASATTALNHGMGSSFEFVTAGYTIETVLTVTAFPSSSSTSSSHAERVSIPSGGVNAALFTFGDFVLARHSKERARGDHNTETEYLGYSTTAYYFYNLCDCEGPAPKKDGKPNSHIRAHCATAGGNTSIPNKYLSGSVVPGTCDSYEDTLLAVDAGLTEQGIPYKHMLLDSWWYGENVWGGVNLWEDVPDCVHNVSFPRGMKSFQDKIGKVLWAHNGKWTVDSEYRKSYEFDDSGGPPQGDALWNHLFSANHDDWGLGTIKQDHIGEQMESGTGFKNISVFKSWMKGMGDGAKANDVGVLYCCAPPSIHMNGVTVPAAYGVRASPDYVWQTNGKALKLPTVQWAIGPDNAFHWNGLGLLPYKDTFFSNDSMTQQSGHWSSDSGEWPPFYDYYEMNSATHALMSLLSMAQVTFGDAVAQSNKTLLMQLVRADGKVLKADRPATAIDRQFQAMMFGNWPGSGGAPSSGGDGAISTKTCDFSSPWQQWAIDKSTGGIGLANTSLGCMDVKQCSTKEGAVVDIFSAPRSMNWVCGTGSKSAGSECHYKNEKWTVLGNQIKSVLSGFCLQADGNSASVAKCDAQTPSQQWSIETTNGVTTIKTNQHDDQLCLSGSQRESNSDGGDWHGFNSEDQLKQAAEALFPSSDDDGNVSPSYKSAYTISNEWMERLEAKREKTKTEECPGGLGAPQGPLGEVYVTHATVSNMTWRYVVGVQLASDFNVSTTDVGLTTTAVATQQHVSYQYNDATTYHLGAGDIHTFDKANPLQLHMTDKAMCQTGRGAIPVETPCFPFQLHTIAPVLSNGWIVVGEVGKFLPMSQQRTTAITVTGATSVTVELSGMPDEVVTYMLAESMTSTPKAFECTIGDDGTGTITASAANMKARSV